MNNNFTPTEPGASQPNKENLRPDHWSRAGDTVYTEKNFDRWLQALYSLTNFDTETAKDCLAEAICNYELRKLDGLQLKEEVKYGYILTAAKNVFLQMVRHDEVVKRHGEELRRLQSEISYNHGEDQDKETEERIKKLDEHVHAKCSKREVQVYELAKLTADRQEIADKLGISRDNVKQNLHNISGKIAPKPKDDDIP